MNTDNTIDLTGLDKASIEDIQSIVLENCQNDNNLETIFRAIKKERGSLWSAVREEFWCSAYFYEDSKNEFIQKLAKQYIRKNNSEDLIDKLMSRNNGDLSGIELKQANSECWVFFCGDADIAGNVRSTIFSEKGFHGHKSRSTYLQVLTEVIQDGYLVETTGQLERCFKEKNFSNK